MARGGCRRWRELSFSTKGHVCELLGGVGKMGRTGGRSGVLDRHVEVRQCACATERRRRCRGGCSKDRLWDGVGGQIVGDVSYVEASHDVHVGGVRGGGGHGGWRGQVDGAGVREGLARIEIVSGDFGGLDGVGANGPLRCSRCFKKESENAKVGGDCAEVQACCGHRGVD